MFRAIDASEEAVGRVLAAVAVQTERCAAWEHSILGLSEPGTSRPPPTPSSIRLEVLQKAADARAGGSTGGGSGLAKLTSWLGAKKPAAATLAADAPVVLPPWDSAAATVSAEAEVLRISAALDSCGRPTMPPSGTEAAATVPTATLPSSSDDVAVTEVGEGVVGTTASGGRSDAGDRGADSAPAQVELGVRAAKAAVAAGEDDDEEEEDDDEEEEDAS